MAKTKQPSGRKKLKVGKQRATTTAFEESDQEVDMFGLSDAEVSEEEQEATGESAEEARLRIAKAYLQQLRAAENDSGSGDEGENALPGSVSAKLRQQALEALGQQSRSIAAQLVIPERSADGPASTSGRFHQCHWKSVTAVALTADDSTTYSVSKDGTICQMDVETGRRIKFRPKPTAQKQAGQDGPDWVKKGPRVAGTAALLAAAVSDDGKFLAVGGGDRLLHIFDAHSHELIQSFPGHRDAITGLAFRQGTHELFSCALDRTVKTWSIDDRAYVDTLFGHQAEVLALDVLRAERALSTGHDHTCRVWKIADESQLICRAQGMALDCCRYVTGTEWLTGSTDGSLALWTQFKKKPVAVVADAHQSQPSTLPDDEPSQRQPATSAQGWIQSVAVCPGSDLAASGAGNGTVRLWAVRAQGKSNRPEALDPLGTLPANGFVNGLQIATSGKFLVAGVGQEPRLGRWARSAGARNGLLIHKLQLQDS